MVTKKCGSLQLNVKFNYALYRVAKIFGGVYFCGLAIFCVLRELIFTIRTDCFFLAGN